MFLIAIHQVLIQSDLQGMEKKNKQAGKNRSMGA